MVDDWQKSKKRSSGSSGKRHKGFTIYLDANFDCREVKDRLSAAKIKFKPHSAQFAADAADSEILSFVGRQGMILITADNRQRFREAERETLKNFRVRQFVFPANLGAPKMAELLVKSISKMRDYCRATPAPFSAKVLKSGKIHLLMDSKGQVFGPQR